MSADNLNYYQLIEQSLADSTLQGQIMGGKFIGTFLQNSTNEIFPVVHNTVSFDIISYVLLFFVTGIAIIWFYIPERLTSIFTISTKKSFSRGGEVTFKTPGILISLFFFLNFILNISIYIFLLIKTYDPGLLSGMDIRLTIFYIMTAIFLFYLFRLVYIKLSGIIFKTGEKATQQLNLYINTDNALGVLLIPILLIVLYTSLDFVIFAGILLLVILQIIRWIMTFLIGISIQGFSVLHLILYLCTLEIIPILILIKVVENGGL